MTVLGIQSGAVLQRDERNLCRITIEAHCNGALKTSLGTLQNIGSDFWCLTEIPVGGPYAVTFSDDTESVTFTDIYVGDMWLLAGQSNMEGCGRITEDDIREAENTNPRIRAFYMDDRWQNAKPVLHHLHLSKDSAHQKTWTDETRDLQEKGVEVLDRAPHPPARAIGPGYYFAKEMFRLTNGVPQGVIPAAVGGAPIEMWLPVAEGNDNYYTAACRRIKETGSHIKGVFWAQGEWNPNFEIYPSHIETIRKDLCARTGKTEMPFVQMQSFKCTLCVGSPKDDGIWNRFREMQRQMPLHTTMLDTIATNDLELDDGIHLSSDSQKKAGVRGAKAMYHLLTGIGCAQPTLDTIYAKNDEFLPTLFSKIHIRYANVAGELGAAGVPFGFVMKRSDSDENPSIRNFRRILLSQNEVIIRVGIPREELGDYELWYGYGNDFYCNITDDENRAIPAMGPITLNEYLSK